MSGQKIINKDVKFGQVMLYAGHRSRSWTGRVISTQLYSKLLVRNDSDLSNSRLDAAGKFAGSLISGASLQVRRQWNQCFAVARRNLPAASRLGLSRTARSSAFDILVRNSKSV